MRATPLLAALVLFLAGCSGFTGTQEPTRTLTPPEAPADTATYPPGVDATGVTSPAALADAHSDRDDNRSYTLVSNRTVRYANGTLRSELRLRVALAENRSYLARIETDGPAGPVLLGRPPAAATYWSDGETYARQLTRGNGTTYNVFKPPDQYTATWRFWTRTVAFGGQSGYAGQTIRRTFSAIPTTLNGTDSVNGTTVYRFSGDEAESTTFAAPDVDTVDNVSFEAVVDRHGLVRRIAYRLDGRVDGERVTVERTIAYRRIGATSVGEPPWLDRARNESG